MLYEVITDTAKNVAADLIVTGTRSFGPVAETAWSRDDEIG